MTFICVIVLFYFLVISQKERKKKAARIISKTRRDLSEKIARRRKLLVVIVFSVSLFARSYITTSRTYHALVYFFCSARKSGVPHHDRPRTRFLSFFLFSFFSLVSFLLSTFLPLRWRWKIRDVRLRDDVTDYFGFVCAHPFRKYNIFLLFWLWKFLEMN